MAYLNFLFYRKMWVQYVLFDFHSDSVSCGSVKVRVSKKMIGMELQRLIPGIDPIPINNGLITAETELRNHGTWIKPPSSYRTVVNTASGAGERSIVDKTHRRQPDEEEQPTNPTTKPLDPNRFKRLSINDLDTNFETCLTPTE